VKYETNLRYDLEKLGRTDDKLRPHDLRPIMRITVYRLSQYVILILSRESKA
jgi:hypothetical protein